MVGSRPSFATSSRIVQARLAEPEPRCGGGARGARRRPPPGGPRPRRRGRTRRRPIARRSRGAAPAWRRPAHGGRSARSASPGSGTALAVSSAGAKAWSSPQVVEQSGSRSREASRGPRARRTTGRGSRTAEIQASERPLCVQRPMSNAAVDEDVEVEAGARAELEHAHAALAAVAERGEPDARDLVEAADAAARARGGSSSTRRAQALASPNGRLAGCEAPKIA